MAVKLIIKDEVNIRLENLPLDARKKLATTFKYENPALKYHPSVKLGRWDGMVSLFGIGGDGFLSQIERILGILDNMGIVIDEIEDNRKPINLTFSKVTESYWADQDKSWPEDHPAAGAPIMLRDYQVAAINTFLENPQSIQELATGMGKCLSYDSLLSIVVVENNDFFIKCNTRPSIEIGKFIDIVEEYKNITLVNNTEVNISDLGCYIPTPDGPARINYVIKKENLSGISIIVENNIEIKCATKHILQQHGNNVFANTLVVGDTIDTNAGPRVIKQISLISDTVFYDIAINAPHLYYDSYGVIHHNTITTATLSHLCEPFGRTMIIVPNKSLVEQTEEDYLNCGLDVGVYFGGRKDLNKTHTICTWQSLNVLDKKNKNFGELSLSLAEFIDGVSAVIVDECHVADSTILHKLLTHHFKNAPIRWGLTGTVPKQAYQFESLYASIGPVVGKIAAHELQEKGVLSNCNINITQLIDIQAFKSYADETKYLLTNTLRMTYVSKMINEIAKTGNTLVLVNRIESGKILVDNLDDAVFISGNVKTKDRKTEYDEIKISHNKTIVATYGVAAVGINIIRINNLVLLEPGKSFTRVIQSIGRGLRKGFDKEHVEIYDITSTCKFAKRHLRERKKFYNESKYPFSITKVDWS